MATARDILVYDGKRKLDFYSFMATYNYNVYRKHYGCYGY